MPIFRDPTILKQLSLAIGIPFGLFCTRERYSEIEQFLRAKTGCFKLPG